MINIKMETITNNISPTSKSLVPTTSKSSHLVERSSVFTCTFVKAKIRMSELFGTSTEENEGEEDDDERLEEAILDPNTVIRLLPMEFHYGGWSSQQHFHPQLVCPNNNSTIVITLEAKARECIAIALSPSPDFVLGKTYVVHLGANGDLCTVIRRRTGGNTIDVEATFPSVRICSDKEYIPYWIIYQKGKLSVGVHTTIPGKNCLGTLEDTIYHTLRPGQDAVRYVGLSNSSLTRRRRHSNTSSRDPSHNVVKIRHLSVIALPSSRAIVMEPYTTTTTTTTTTIAEDTELLLLRDYEEECRKAQARAKKFGIAYTDPSPEAFFKWSEARRLRANPAQGFATGFDLTTTEEEEKRRARKERFSSSTTNTTPTRTTKTEATDNNSAKKRKADTDVTDIIQTHEEEEGEEEEEEEQKQTKHRPPLPVIQAWDNEELVRQFRVDPPIAETVENVVMSSQAPHREEEEEEDDDEYFHVGVQTLNNKKEPINNNDDDVKESTEITTTTLVPEKLHIFAIDWAAFKQIRSEDIMDYFSLYGPSYIEWLGELSCNVLFEDRFSAARAFKALSQEIPPPPQVPLTNSTTEEENDPAIALPDLGKMGWRFCTKPLRKIANDRFGCKGTRARILMRVSNVYDILEKRPTEWPKPPPGFTTRRVLGPGSDFPATSSTPHHRRPHHSRRDKFHKRPRREVRLWVDDQLEESDYSNDDKDYANLPYSSALDRELKSSRYSLQKD